MNTDTLGVIVLTVIAVMVGAIATVPVAAQTGSEETYVHEVDAIRTHSDGQICAEKVAPNVNRVEVGNSTHINTSIYHHNTARDIYINIPKFNSLSQIVLYTDGSNPVVDALARLGECTPPGMDVECTIVVNEYNISLGMETPEGIEVRAGPNAAGEPPSPERNPGVSDSPGCLGVSTGNDSSSTTDVTLPDNPETVNETVGNTTDQVNDTVDNTTDLVNDTVDNATDPVNDTVDNATDEVNETTNPVTEVVEKAVDTVTSTVENVTDMVTGTNDTSSESESSTLTLWFL